MRKPLAPLLILAAASLAAPATLGAQQETEQPAQEPATTETQTAPAPPPPAPKQPATPAPPAPQPAQTAPAPPPPVDVVEPQTRVEPKKKKKRAEPVARVAAAGSVTIKDFEFGPASVTVNVGDSVTWTNQGPAGHSATATDGSFDTGILAKGKSGSHTFQEAGTFSYVCTPHPNMKGTVTVEGASTGGGSESPTAAADDTGTSAADTESTDSSGDDLPATGSEPGILAGLGLCFLVLGLTGRRRTRD